MGISKCCISSLLPALSLEQGWGRDLSCPTEPRPLSCPKEPDPEAPTPLALWTCPFPCSGENSKPCCWEGGLGGRRIPSPAVREVFVGFNAGSRGPGRGQPSVLGWKMLFSKVDSLRCEQLPFCLSCVFIFREALLFPAPSLSSPEPPAFPGEGTPVLALGLPEAKSQAHFRLSQQDLLPELGAGKAVPAACRCSH